MTTIYFTKSDLCQSINAATAAARNNTKQLRRIEHAALWLAQFPGTSFALKTDTIKIKSETSNEVYTLTLGDDCMEHVCRSQKPCWHLTLGSLIMAANTIRQERELRAVYVRPTHLVTEAGQPRCPRCQRVMIQGQRIWKCSDTYRCTGARSLEDGARLVSIGRQWQEQDDAVNIALFGSI